MTAASTTRSAAPPSRELNPFATCWTKPGALPFHYPDGQSADRLVAKLASQHWRGAILGAHGSGKSTLLESLKPAIRAAGRDIRSIGLHDGQRQLPRNFLARGSEAANSVVIIDGYEQLGWSARLRLWRYMRSTGGGLLVTSHTPVRLPVLIHLAPGRDLVEQLVDELCADLSTPITRADIVASHACHGSNVREIFSDLYDRHEIERRKSNRRALAT